MAKKKSEGINFFQKYLTIWVFICMVVGVIIGKLLPAIPNALGNLEISGIPIAILIWIMIYPMMLKVDFQSIKQVGKNPKGLFITWITNWLIKPFTMYGIASLFLFTVFKGFIAPELATQYLAGAVLLGAAPCTTSNGICMEYSYKRKFCLYCGTGCNKRFNHTDWICANCKVFAWSIKCISTLRNIVFQCDSVCGDSTCWGCINKNSCS